MYKFLILYLFSFYLYGQDTISLEAAIVKKNIDILSTLKNVKKNIDKNYKTGDFVFLDSKFLSEKNKDTILYFDGIINFNPNYRNNDISTSKVCFERKKNININQLIDWFPYKVGKSDDLSINPPYNKEIPFFLNNIIYFIGIENIPIFRNIKDFTYNYSFLERRTLKIDFYSNNSKYPYKGYIILDNNTYTILESYYTNYESFYVNELVIKNFKRRKDLETRYFIKKIEISSKYSKENETDKYSLSHLNTFVSFEEKDSIKYNSYSIIKSITPPLNCRNESINLRFIDSFFDKK